MAIISPADLPVVLKLNSDSMKSYALKKLGHPQVDVEVSEPQLEESIRVVGDFISMYFPREQRLAVFYTQPLIPTYDLPEDAYWVQEVSWDPVTTRIDDVFGAESFLFCAVGGTHVLTTKGPRTIEEASCDKNVELATPFGSCKPRFKFNNKKQPIQVLQTESDYLAYTPNHPVHIEGKFRMSIQGFPSLHLLDSDDKTPEIIDRARVITDGTWSVETDCGCYYASALGKKFYLVH